MGKKTWLIWVVLMAVLASLSAGLAAKPEVKDVTPATLKGMLGDPRVMVIDVRIPKAWADSKKMIKGAVRQDPGKVPTWAKTLPKDQKIVLYCS